MRKDLNITLEQLQALNTKEDLLGLINEVKSSFYADAAKVYPITLKHFVYQIHDKHNEHGKLVTRENRYVTFTIPKKNGSFRTISAPNRELKDIQRCLNVILQQVYEPNSAAMGFIPGKSVVDNAKVHVGSKYVYNIDLKDFFPSITGGRVYSCLTKKPFNLVHEIASTIANLCCHEGVLPQGAPTSPTLTNIICSHLDNKLNKLAIDFGLKYSRYADDITFSGSKNMFDEDKSFVQKLHQFIEMEGFHINSEKTRLNSEYVRQEVTGLTVNVRPNVSKKYVSQIRTMLKNMEYDYSHAQEVFLQHYHPVRNAKGNHHIENILAGKLDYMKMVKGEDDSQYLKYKERFEKVLASLTGMSASLSEINKRDLDKILQDLCDSDFDLSVL